MKLYCPAKKHQRKAISSAFIRICLCYVTQRAQPDCNLRNDLFYLFFPKYIFVNLVRNNERFDTQSHTKLYRIKCFVEIIMSISIRVRIIIYAL